MMKTARTAVLIALVLAFLTSAGSCEILRVRYTFDDSFFIPTERGHRLSIRGTRSMGLPGEPVMPVRTARVLIPYGQYPVKAWLEVREEAEMPGVYAIEFGRPVQPIGLHPASNDRRNEKVYRSSMPYPRTPFQVLGVQTARGHTILMANIYPARYVPASGKITIYRSLDLVVETADSPKLHAERRWVRSLRTTVLPDNPEALSTYPVTTGTAQYLVITSARLASYFQPLIEWKERKGLCCRVALVEDIEASVDGVDLQEKIRNFIRQCYLNEHTEYVLLGGDDEIIPARGVWGQVESYVDTNMPSDLYYAALDGNWNSDGDSTFGEPTDGLDGGEVDLLAEVLVGRAPVETPEEVQNFVAKTIRYEQDPGPNISTLVWVGEQLDAITSGSESKEAIARIIPEGYVHVRLYDKDKTFSPQAVRNMLNASPHTVNHLGHSSEYYALGLQMQEIQSLRNEYPFFVYSQGCYAGAFDSATSGESDCAGERFVIAPAGAFAGVFNSRYGWYSPGEPTAGPSHYFDYEFYKAVFVDGQSDPSLCRLGAAHQHAKEELIGTITDTAMRWCYLNLNLFGDPEAAIYNVLPKGKVSFNAREYRSTARPVIRVTDYDLNTDHSLVDSVEIGVYSSTEESGETIVLREVGPNSGIFMGELALAVGPPASDGILQVSHGDTITAVYLDENDGLGNRVESQATATIDDVPPVISGVHVEALRDSSAKVCWITDEPSNGAVEYGIAPNLASEATESDFGIAHSIRIADLLPDSLYRFAIRSADEAGNVTRLDAAELQFRTLWATDVFFDDVEPHSPSARGFWRSSSVLGNAKPWERQTAVALSKRFAWHADDVPSPSAVVLDTPQIDLTSVSTPQLTFWHRMRSELNYDGGFVQISTDGGLHWRKLSQEQMIKGTPFGRIGSTCPTPGEEAWTGDIPWEKVIFDIADFGGKTVIVRFRMESDMLVDAGEGDGWYIDDIQITGVHGIVALDKAVYRPNEQVKVMVYDGAANKQHGSSAVAPVQVCSRTEPIGEPVRPLHATARRGQFSGVIQLVEGAPQRDGLLQVQASDLLTASYSDRHSASQVTARVDGIPPRISNVRVTDIGVDTAVIRWETDEPAESIVRYGIEDNLALEYYDGVFRTEHVATLRNLRQTSVYHFVISCSDEAGNTSADDNRGCLYSFVTEGFILSGLIAEDMTLVAIPGHPWIVAADTQVQAGVTLTIEPGAVLKFGKGGRSVSNASLTVYGSLQAAGTPEKPIVFTSIRDDDAWGDSNGDEGATSPDVGDWGTIHIASGRPDAVRVFRHCVFKYSGSDGGRDCAAIECRSGGAVIADCTFDRNYFPIAMYLGGQPTVSNLTLLSNRYNGIWIRPGMHLSGDTLSTLGMPYVIASEDGRDLTIAKGRTLRVMPGVVIKMGGMGSPFLNSSLIVGGSLQILGTAEQPVIVTSLMDDSVLGDTNGDGTSTVPSRGDWGRIALTGTDCIIQHCIIRYAGMDSGVESPAVDCLDTSPVLRYCEISANRSGLRFVGGAPQVCNCTVAMNSMYGLLFDQVGEALVKNCILAFNKGCGISASSSQVSVVYSDVFGNGGGDWCGITPGEGCFSVDPSFADPDLLNFRLRYTSPCIDSGDPTEADPGSTSRIDVGAYPYGG